jgi:hypothetical protein
MVVNNARQHISPLKKPSKAAIPEPTIIPEIDSGKVLNLAACM